MKASVSSRVLLLDTPKSRHIGAIGQYRMSTLSRNFAYWGGFYYQPLKKYPWVRRWYNTPVRRIYLRQLTL